ncbi:hypothetical protein BU26DRAFT_551659 [Trematosphaeria pertusa]|uniref:Uncharacterized protein n=1 Tax=Trematosphaeria pertusa TaxID=390896 RepID=A0A6A6ICN3_9PLEO|nr:uncharacterized protein BU26DRAFT_551659 [Trematosphaeria pertusa]KAF2248335.1 hypothetical protein BU26DRAFT_551659 [Trematosphaeria pertusa]
MPTWAPPVPRLPRRVRQRADVRLAGVGAVGKTGALLRPISCASVEYYKSISVQAPLVMTCMNKTAQFGRSSAHRGRWRAGVVYKRGVICDWCAASEDSRCTIRANPALPRRQVKAIVWVGNLESKANGSRRAGRQRNEGKKASVGRKQQTSRKQVESRTGIGRGRGDMWPW